MCVLERIEAQLERIGLLLEHDKHLPSATALVAGAAIDGSWWGHELGHDIYAILGDFEQRSGALCLKLVSGKRTYVHRRLYEALFALLEQRRPVAIQGCSVLAQQLLGVVEQHGLVRLDAIAVAPAKQLGEAARELEAALLVKTSSLHTDSGKHAKTLEGWSAWLKRHQLAVQGVPLTAARAALDEALTRLAQGLARKPRTALLTD